MSEPELLTTEEHLTSTQVIRGLLESLIIRRQGFGPTLAEYEREREVVTEAKRLLDISDEPVIKPPGAW